MPRVTLNFKYVYIYRDVCACVLVGYYVTLCVTYIGNKGSNELHESHPD